MREFRQAIEVKNDTRKMLQELLLDDVHPI